ncbi:ABC transporter substrate-binding protein, partial [Pseudomonas aeruginosa]
MKRHLWIVMIATILILAGCSQSNDSKSSSNKDKQASDGKSPYHRIISLMPSNTEILYELGLGDNVVGISTV